MTDLSMHRARREALAQRMRERGGGVAIIATAPEVMRSRDSDYDYRADSYFWYLSGFTEPEAVLVLVADAQTTQTVLFCRAKDIEREIWDGYRLGPEAAPAALGIDAAHPIASIDTELPKLIANRPALFHAFAQGGALDAQLQRWIASVRAQARIGVTAPSASYDVFALLDEMRLVKDAHELDTMRRAARISAAAHARAMHATRAGRYEYEIEAELLHEFRRNGAQAPAYGSIVAGGAHACVLHYRANDAQLADGQLLLIDAGCELDGYASDITRTFPINGRYTRAQRAIYDLVLAAQEAAIAAVAPGHSFDAPHQAALAVLAQGMVDLGLCQGSASEVIESGAYKQFYMHRTSHWLGMDVHDVGSYRVPGAVSAAGSATEPPWRSLQPGMVLTIEPGLYVRPADDVPDAYWNIGVRIEDDAVVTAHGREIITADAPKQADAIERLMRTAAPEILAR